MMTDHKKIAQETLLKMKNRIRIFDSLASKDILSITNSIRFIKYKDGEFIFKEGDNGKDIFYLIEGGVCVFISKKENSVNKDINLINMESGDVFGEFSPIAMEPRNASAVSTSNDTKVIAFRLNDMNMELSPPFALMYKNIVNILIEKIKKNNEVLFDYF